MRAVIVAVPVAALLAASNASAHPLELDHVFGAELGAELGYGLPPFTHFDTDPFGLGLGLHGGVALLNFYAGVSFRYFFGHTDPMFTQVGGELGYNLTWGRLTLRPGLFLGASLLSPTPNTATGGTTKIDTHMTVAPGIFGRVRVVGPAFVGADVRYNFVFGGDPVMELSLMGSVGVAFQ